MSGDDDPEPTPGKAEESVPDEREASSMSPAPEVDAADDASGSGPGGASDEASDDAAPEDGGRDVGRLLNYLLIGGATLFAAIAAIQLYLATGRAIGRWIAPEFRDLFRAAFNLVVLLVAVGVIVRQRRAMD